MRIRRGTWHDAKTGEGGGVKEFAKIAFDLDLPHFMERFGSIITDAGVPKTGVPAGMTNSVSHTTGDLNAVWKKLQPYKQHADLWLRQQRGIKAGSLTQQLFADICAKQAQLFPKPISSFLIRVLRDKTALISPLINPATEQVVNFLLRFTDNNSHNKAVFLPGLPIVGEEVPFGFGSPQLFTDFPEIILCEGLTDTLTANYLTEDNEKVLVIGAPSARQLPLWGKWLAHNCSAKVTIVYHLDKAGEDISIQGIGQKNALKALSYFADTPARASLFPWSRFLGLLEGQGVMGAFTSIYDLTDACQRGDASVVKGCFRLV